jgi:hypothetical protein
LTWQFLLGLILGATLGVIIMAALVTIGRNP